MGVQDMLLLVLSVLLVGIAISVGINMFNDQARKADQQYIVQYLMQLASRAEALYQTPASQCGLGHSYRTLRIEDITDSPTTDNATYWLQATDSTCTIFGKSHDYQKVYSLQVSGINIGNVQKL